MHDRTWTFTRTSDGQHEGFSSDEAAKVIRRAMYGLDPFGNKASGNRKRSKAS